MAVSNPRRVRSARTPTRVTAAIGSAAPPGTAISLGNDVAVATNAPASCTPSVRPGL